MLGILVCLPKIPSSAIRHKEVLTLPCLTIGANDVANAWATSVGSRSVTYLQAMIIASIMEFSGSVGVGARVADTIRTGIVDTTRFTENPALLMLGMVCAVTASSIYLTMATKFGLPVSTTHSIMGGVIGMGVAALGVDGIQWVARGSASEIINGGVVQVFLAWIIAPTLAGCFAAAIFTITKYGVLVREKPVLKALMYVPVYFGLTAALLSMLLLWKGGSYSIALSDSDITGVVLGIGFGWAFLTSVTLIPWLYRVVIMDDWQLRWWHIPLGLWLLRRPDPPPMPADHETVRNFYEGHLSAEELESKRAARPAGVDEEAPAEKRPTSAVSIVSETSGKNAAEPARKKRGIIGPKPDGEWYAGPVLFWYVKWVVFRGVDQDVVGKQGDGNMLSGNLDEMHARAAHYDNKAEYMYSFLQIMTAATASFSHGANDIANAIGPYTTIFQIWNSGVLSEGESEVPLWILVFGSVMLVLGLWTYGYNIMANLGNRITLHSPSRGFSMELGSAITVILATRLSKVFRMIKSQKQVKC
jgi:solute carrier family 20 (sodium-dependent phosphate transporter)